MIKVALQGAEFFAYHGFYPEEQLIGGRFVLDIEVEFEATSSLNGDNINHTINYENLYQIASTQMRETKKLLETVAQAILDAITTEFDFIKTATVTLRKLNPPLGGQVGASVITVTYQNVIS